VSCSDNCQRLHCLRESSSRQCMGVHAAALLLRQLYPTGSATVAELITQAANEIRRLRAPKRDRIAVGLDEQEPRKE
jgi:hypothetical protein